MITSRKNELVKTLKALMSKSSERRRSGTYVIEGIRMFKEAPFSYMRMAVLSETFCDANRDISERLDDSKIPYEILSDELFDYISGTVTPQGIMAVMDSCQAQLDDMLSVREPFIILLEATQDPGNLGTILRTAEAAGVTGVIMGSGSADITSPKVVRSTMGAVFRIPYLTTEDFCGTVSRLKDRGVRIVATSPAATKSLFEAELSGAVGILVGNEAAGLSKEVMSLADDRVVIPMTGNTESLNAASAATLCMYEVFRRRIKNGCTD